MATIQISPETKKKLNRIRRKGETYDEVLRRLLTNHEELIFMEEQYKILDDNIDWVPLEELK